MKNISISILHLYPDRMSIYGDYGNIIALQQRMAWRGIEYDYYSHEVGDKLTRQHDIIFMGGGQDSGQLMVAKDLHQNQHYIRDHFNSNKPILTICGGYQLFGHKFITQDDIEIKGIGVFDIVTQATSNRMIGNIAVESETFGNLVGFENHSGATQLLNNTKPLGKVINGYGNDGESKEEGVFIKNAIGTYLHGSFLPKNPKVTDFIIKQALLNKGIQEPLKKLDDLLENQTREWIINNR